MWTHWSPQNKESPCAHAGSGFTWDTVQLPRVAFPILKGDAQTKDRAELEALCATMIVGPNVSLATVIEWVSNGVEVLLKARRETGTASLTSFYRRSCMCTTMLQEAHVTSGGSGERDAQMNAEASCLRKKQ